MNPTSRLPGYLPSIIFRMLFFSIIWIALVNGVMSSLWIGMPAVLISLTVSIYLVPPTTFAWYELFRFSAYFLIRSLIGGIDVARRAYHPALPIKPDLVEYTLRLPPGLARIVMVNTVNLLPGTLVAKLNNKTMKVHVLDRQQDFRLELETVEKHVARLFHTSRLILFRSILLFTFSVVY